STLVTALEIAAWLGALLCGLLAGWLCLTRQRWQRPLLIGLGAVVVLLTLTFVFPPLWARAALDAALIAGLLWNRSSADGARMY
ncbi:MAG TPA: hypothetical protein PK954_07255, partial [Anaerolineales bacterium]|nr:hypothetical protein [Anaerolineales bacterium]